MLIDGYLGISLLACNLGFLLQTTGDLAGARPYYEQALAIRKQALGETHPDTAYSLNNLGMLEAAEGNLEAATNYLRQALANFEKALGPNHSNTKTVRANLESLQSQRSNG